MILKTHNILNNQQSIFSILNSSIISLDSINKFSTTKLIFCDILFYFLFLINIRLSNLKENIHHHYTSFCPLSESHTIIHSKLFVFEFIKVYKEI